MAIHDEVGFELPVDVPNDVKLARFMVLPAIFRNQLLKDRNVVTLVDSNGDRTDVFWYAFEYVKAALGNLNWPVFYNNNIVGDIAAQKLCFILLEPNVFEVMCFNSDALEIVRNGDVRSLRKSFLIKALDTTIEREYIPPIILQDLNDKTGRKPISVAKLYGPQQNAEVDVIYHYHVNHTELERWRVVGIQGSKWTNMVTVNGVEDGFTMMFTDLRNGKYGFHVFNARGVGVGLIDSSTEGAPIPDWVDVPRLDVDEVEPYHSEESEIEGDYIHECRVRRHKHVALSNPYFTIRMNWSSVSHNNVTVPAYFVREHKLYEYNRAVLIYGHLQFFARLDVKMDVRRPGDQSHVVMHRDWQCFMDQTGFMVKDPVKFKLKKAKLVVGGDAWFRVC